MLTRIILLFPFFLFSLNNQAQNLLINEAVSANHDRLDQDGDSPDWFEIHNPGDAVVNLAGWSITDDPEGSEPWIFPDKNLFPGSYLRVWASDKNRTENTFNLHTDFKISDNGETLHLYRPDGTEAHTLTLPGGLQYYAYGLPAGGNEPAVLSETTPGNANPAQGFAGILPDDISFSHPGGVCAPLVLQLTTGVPGGIIRYTTDALLPDENSAVFPAAGLQLNEKTVLRARVFLENYLPSRTRSRAFLVDVSHTLPVVSIITEPDNFFDENTGIYAFGYTYASDPPYSGANFHQDWERPAHFSFYEPDGTDHTEFDAGVKIFGGYSRSNPQRSLAFFARKQYGTEEINYPFFESRDFDEFQSIVLRNSGNDFLASNIRDIMYTGLLEGAGIEIQAHRSAATYLNGEYWGMYNMREKVSKHFLASRYDVEPEEIDLLVFDGTVVDGDNTAYFEMLEILENGTAADPEVYEYIEEQIDIENYAMYQTAQIYAANMDWPGNNIKFWRAPGRKWRWILYDTDFGFAGWFPNAHGHNTLEFALVTEPTSWSNPAWSTFLFRKLLESTEFRNIFVNRFADELNSRFLPENVLARIAETKASVIAELPAHYERWDGDFAEFAEHHDRLTLFATERPEWIKGYMLDELALPAYHTLDLQSPDFAHGKVLINNRLDIQEESWSGDYFETVPIVVTAQAEPNAVFLHWEGDTLSTDPTLVFDLKKDFTLIPVFRNFVSPDKGVNINEVNYHSAENRNTEDWIELYNDLDHEVDISGWVLREAASPDSLVLPAGTLISGKGYLIISKDGEKFRAVYPEIEPLNADFNFNLPEDKGTVTLYNERGESRGNMTYTSAPPQPQTANGNGGTLELLRPDLDTDRQKNWKSVHPFGSPGATNIPAPAAYAGEFFLDLNVFPNPVQDLLDVRFALTLPTAVTLNVYDGRGILLKNLLHEELAIGSHFLNFSVGDLARGVYFLEVTGEGGERVIFKLVRV